MLAGAVKKLAREWGIDVNIKSSDLMTAKSESADVFITAKRLANELHGKDVIVIRSYTNEQKITDDIKETILNLAR